MDKLTTVLVGCGDVASAWLGELKNFAELEITGLVDIEVSRAEKFKQHFKLEKAIASPLLSKVLKVVNADVVIDCTIPSAHPNVTLAALNHDCHVLGEKPMAESMPLAAKMVDKAKQQGKIYAVTQNYRYNKDVICFRELVNSGRLGELNTLNIDFYQGIHFGGYREQMKHVLLLDMAIHSFDLARFISGLDPISVYCQEWNPKGSWYKHGASAQAIFELQKGVVFNYRGSWCAEDVQTSWNGRWRAQCSSGGATWDGEGNINAVGVSSPEDKVKKIGSFKPDRPKPLKHAGHSGVIREFIDCLKEGSVPQTVCTDNIKSLAMVLAAIESAETGKKVKIEY